LDEKVKTKRKANSKSIGNITMLDEGSAQPQPAQASPEPPNPSVSMQKGNARKKLADWLAAHIDHTLLYPDARAEDIVKVCAEAAEYKFFAVCVNPFHVKRAVRELASTEVVVATVVGFPLGADLTDIKIAQAQRALFEGAEELDMVINIGALKDRASEYVLAEIQSIVRASGGQRVKVIIECGLLTEEEKILATELCVKAGAAMVKTCTGFAKNDKGATVEDVILLKKTIEGLKNIYEPLQIKASGGIKDYNHALALIEAGAARIGTSASVSIIKETYNKDARNKGKKIKENHTIKKEEG
jgi:deoxyribose-phosphate aldolase